MPTRLLSEGLPMRTPKPICLAWSSKNHVHFVALVAVTGFKDIRVPFFPAEEGSLLCAPATDEHRINWAAPSLSMEQLRWFDGFRTDWQDTTQQLYNHERAAFPGQLPSAAKDR